MIAIRPSVLRTLPLLAMFGLCACEAVQPVAGSGDANGTDYFSPREVFYEDRVYDPDVHTVQLFRKGAELSAPMLEFGSPESLILRFDDLGGEDKDLSYTVVQCDADWRPSDLLPGQYLTGAFADFLSPARHSYGTIQPFVEYELEVPNRMMQITRSGNYILKVYAGSNADEPLLTRRFLVYERAVEVDAIVQAARDVERRNSAQHLDLTIRHPGFPIPEPFADLHVTVLQNMRWDDARTGLQPRYVRDAELVYDFPAQTLFNGNNEWRNFDVRNLRYITREVLGYDVGPHLTEVSLRPSDKRNISQYLNRSDNDGRYLVYNEDVNGDPLGADYLQVHFTLPQDDPVADGAVYLFGGFSDFQCRKEFRMTYDDSLRQYTGTALLKQGFYDYAYAVLGSGSTVADLSRIEGTHYQTENDYLVLVYLTDHTLRSDRLIGMRWISSRQ